MQKANSPKRGPGKAADRKAALSAQQTIPYLVMHPDGVCQLPGGLYTKTVEYEDINYSVASTEDQTAIFGGWSSFLNYFFAAPALGRFAPYLERAWLRPATP